MNCWYIPTDRVIDGVDQTSLLVNGDSHSRRDYVHIYSGETNVATVKKRFKRHWVGELASLSGASFFDLYIDPGEVQPKMPPVFTTNGMFNAMKARHELWNEKYPHAKEARGFPFTGVENARPETIKAPQARFSKDQVPFDVDEVMKRTRDLENFEANGGIK